MGQIIALQDRLDREIAIRKTKAWRSFWAMKPIFKSGIPLSLKATLLATCTYPVWTYAAQTWAPTLTQLNKVYKTQLAMGTIRNRNKDKRQNMKYQN